MRNLFRCVVLVLLLAAYGEGQNNANSPHSDKPVTKLYLTAKGPEEMVQLYTRFLDKAVDEFGIRRVADPHDADAVIDVTITADSIVRPLYANLVLADFLLADGKPLTMDVCMSVSKDEQADVSQAELVIPQGWIKEHASLSAVFVENGGQADPRLMERLQKSLVAAGFHIVKDRRLANVVLKNAATRQEPMQVTLSGHRIYTRLLKIKYESNLIRVTHHSIQPLASQRAGVCLPTAETFWQPDAETEKDGFWLAAHHAVKTLVENNTK